VTISDVVWTAYQTNGVDLQPGSEEPYRLYRAMHFSAKRGIAIACRLSVCPSVRPSVTLVNCDHIGWNSSKIISPLVSLGRSLFATPTRRVCSKGTPRNWVWAKRSMCGAIPAHHSTLLFYHRSSLRSSRFAPAHGPPL